MIMDLIMAAGGSGLYQQTQKLLTSNTSTYDYAGWSVAVSADGNTCAVGARAEDNVALNSGAVYIFTRAGTTWSEQDVLYANDPVAGDALGWCVALSADGSTCAAGAFFTDAGAANAGAVYIFTRTGSDWSQQTKLLAGDAAADDSFGDSVALSADGNTCAVGARFDDNSGGPDAGSVYVFTRTGSTWSPQTRLQAGDASGGSSFGDSVALSADGNTCAIGASATDSPLTNAGAVYVFTRSGATWTPQQKLVATTPAAFDALGVSVALSADGNTCAAGAQGVDSGGSNVGAAYIFTRSGSTWTQQARLQATDAAAGDELGASVALSSDGSVCVAGAGEDDNPLADAGSAYVFTRVGVAWTQQQRLQASDKTVNAKFGDSVSLSGNGRTCVVGAHQANVGAEEGAGAAYVFLW